MHLTARNILILLAIVFTLLSAFGKLPLWPSVLIVEVALFIP